MNTENCIYCENVFENMKGKLLIQVKTPDEAVYVENVRFVRNVDINEKNHLFSVSLAPSCVYIYDVTMPMDLYIPSERNSMELPDFIRVEPNEFTHLQVEYDYYYYKNQPRVKRARLKRIEHLTSKDLYNIK